METKFNPVGFSLVKVVTEQFAIIESAFSETAETGFSVKLNFGVDSELNLVATFVKIMFTQNDVPFLIVEGQCQFQIAPQNWTEFKREGDSITIPKSLLQHLFVLTIGTTRGILHAKTENTPFNRFLIPTINVTELITDDLSAQILSAGPSPEVKKQKPGSRKNK